MALQLLEADSKVGRVREILVGTKNGWIILGLHSGKLT